MGIAIANRKNRCDFGALACPDSGSLSLGCFSVLSQGKKDREEDSLISDFVGVLRGNTIRGNLSGPVRDTPPYRAIPFRDSIAEGGIAPICLVFIGYRASIAEIPLLRGGYRTSTSHALHGGNAQTRGRGYRTQLAM